MKEFWCFARDREILREVQPAATSGSSRAALEIASMDKLRALRCFMAAASEKSFSAAARALEVSVPVVAKMINALEKDLRVTLFERTMHGLTLTAAGAGYLEACAPALARLDEADEQARGLAERQEGRLVVAVQHVIARGCLTAALPRFHARHPGIELDLRDFRHVSDAEASGVDLTLALSWPGIANLVCRRIAAGRFVVVASPEYLERHGTPRMPKELEGHVCLPIRSLEDAVVDVWNFTRGAEQASVRVRGWLTTRNAHRDLVIELAGHGIARILDWTNLPEITSGALVPILADWQSPEAPPVNLIYRANMRRIPRARCFIDFSTQLFRELDQLRGSHVAAMERPFWLARKHGRASDLVPRPNLGAAARPAEAATHR